MTLHIISSPSPERLSQASSLSSEGDEFLFVGDALYLLPSFSRFTRYRIKDAEVRGLIENMPTTAIGVTDTEWVELTLSCTRTLTWY